MKTQAIVVGILLLISVSGCSRTISMVHFWAPWCSSCVVELEEIGKLSKQMPCANIEVKTFVSQSTESELNTFLKTHEYPFSVMYDEGDIESKKYGINELPQTIFLDENGEQLEIVDPITESKTKIISGSRSWNGQAMRAAICNISTR